MKQLELIKKFNATYPNIPVSERRMPIYVSKRYGPLSWYVVKIEVDNGTLLGFEALKFMARLKII